MTDVIKMDYDKMEKMSQTFMQGSMQLEETAREMQAVAATLEDGVLLGRGGSAFSEAVKDKLCPAIARLQEKFDELALDIQKAMQDMKSADDDSAALY